MSRVAIVTGSNKGIGLGIVKELLNKFDGIVYLTAREDARGKEAVAELNKQGLKPQYHQLDVADRNSIIRFRDHIQTTHGGFDILINNAGVANSKNLFDTYEESKYIIDINYYSHLTIQELLVPLVRNNGRILNVSSDCGHLSNVRNKYWIERLLRKDLKVSDINKFVEWYLEGVKNGTFNKDELADGGTIPAYRISKVALCALTILQQKELEHKDVAVNSYHPGLVQTNMTKGVGFLTAEEAGVTPVNIVLSPNPPKGQYIWYDGSILDWYDHTADYFFKYSTLQGVLA